ncbi:uncharacterized protein LOC125872960 [Solanum stenotomum]|uniref:uncharacterized protein LOC125872960 n=1 Tax=Solanum stenotomum TaxID=172797 RepID=UPI0020D01ADE|nr:uncharacterized protein LOC125872960 [Solanum stenotomum]
MKEEEKEKRSCSTHKRIGEVAGGTAAECAMVCCCCPCTVMHLLVLAVYKVPTGLCRNIWRKKKQERLLRKKKKEEDSWKSMKNNKNVYLGAYDEDDGDREKFDGEDDDGVREAADFETEMWDRFYGAGFWRTLSQREEDLTWHNQNK